MSALGRKQTLANPVVPSSGHGIPLESRWQELDSPWIAATSTGFIWIIRQRVRRSITLAPRRSWLIRQRHHALFSELLQSLTQWFVPARISVISHSTALSRHYALTRRRQVSFAT
jgi:hypothetical protein